MSIKIRVEYEITRSTMVQYVANVLGNQSDWDETVKFTKKSLIEGIKQSLVDAFADQKVAIDDDINYLDLDEQKRVREQAAKVVSEKFPDLEDE